MRKFLVTAATAVAMAAAPTIASAQRASAPAPTAAVTDVQPSSEQVDGNELGKIRGGFLLPLAILVAIILALLLTQKSENQDLPTSP